MLLFHANIFKAIACREHSNFLKVKVANTTPRNQAQHVPREDAEAESDHAQSADRPSSTEIQLRAF